MRKDYYIWLDGMEIPVSEEVYSVYKRAEWCEEKQCGVRNKRESSFEFMCENDFDGQAVADQILVDEIVVDKLLLDELYVALAKLTDGEQSLINDLFYHEKSERAIASESGVPQTTINYRKNQILEYLKKKLKEF